MGGKEWFWGVILSLYLHLLVTVYIFNSLLYSLLDVWRERVFAF
jgi:hypothetical protein